MSSPPDSDNTGVSTGHGEQAQGFWSGRLSDLVDAYQESVTVREEEPLRRHCSMRVGGDAAAWIEVGEREPLRGLVAVCDAHDVPVYPVGLGSNTMFPDAGIDGVVLRLTGELADWEVLRSVDDRARIRVGAGTVNAHLVRELLAGGWTGLEFLKLVPGTFGGAVALNAGTKEAELAERLDAVEWCRPNDGESGRAASERGHFQRVDADRLNMSYRYAEIPEGAVIVAGEAIVERGDVERARERMEADRERRDETQPYKLASWGSTFANPPDDYAGRLIDEAGLKGRRLGGARISEHHANFFINEDDATADDLLSLMALARVRVREKFGVTLRPEVRFVGFDGMSRLRELESRWRESEPRSDTVTASG